MFKVIFGLCLFVSIPLFSQQSCTLEYKGIVLDKHDQQPVSGAKIQIKGSDFGAITDSNGYFLLSKLCPGTYEITCIHHIGCKPIRFEKQVLQNSFDTLYIEFHLDDLDEISVVRNVFEASSLSVVKPSELEQKFGLGKSLGEILKQLPGVTSMNTGSSISKPVIHGMHSNRIVLMNHEIRQEGQQWGSEHAPEIDPFLSTEMTLVKGANAVRYGSDAIAGVIILAPAKLSYQPGLRGKFQSTGFSNGWGGSVSGKLEGGFEKIKNLSWRLQGTLKQNGTMHTPKYLLKNTAYREQNFSWNVAYQRKKWSSELFYSQFNTDLGIFSGAHVGTLNDLYNAFHAAEPLEKGSFSYQIDRPKQHIEHELFKFKNQFLLSKNHKINVLYGRQFNLREEYDNHTIYNDSLAKLNLPSFHFALTTHIGEVKYEHQFAKNLSGEIGTSVQYQKNTFQGRFFIPNFEKKSIGVYWIEVLKVGKTEIEFAARQDFIFLDVFLNEADEIQQYKHQFQHASFTLGSSRLFGHHLQLKYNFSNAWRAPQVNELYSNGLHHGAAAIEIGERKLEIERSYQLQSGLVYKSNRFNAQLDVYTNYLEDFIYLKASFPAQLTIKGAFPVFNFTQITALFYGFDFQASYELGKDFDVSVKGALVRARDFDTKSYLIGIPADRIEPGMSYTKKFKKNQKLQAQVSVPIVGKQIRVAYGADYLPPPDSYYLVNASLSMDFWLGRQNISLQFEVSNLLNRSYRDYLNRFRYYCDEAGRNFGLKLTVPFTIKEKKYETDHYI